MDKKLSDEQLDRIAKNLLKDFALDAETLDEIAESPRLWWNVRRRIEAEKAQRTQSRFAVLRPRLLAFGAAAILVCGGLAVLVLSRGSDSNSAVAEQKTAQKPLEEAVKKPEETANVSPSGISQNPESPKRSESSPVPEKVGVKNAAPQTRFVAGTQRRENSAKQAARASKKQVLPETETGETKTDFIALSYAANTDSGQIVRVKVPSSMMVSLGLKTNVEKESELVSAEVVIGDDGLARAIRFIR